MEQRPDRTARFWLAGGALFVVLATANGAGYRFAATDQAFYVPAILRAMDPGLFPRDSALLEAQSRFMVLDEVLAAITRVTGLSLEAVFLAGYLLSLLLVWTGAVLIGQRVYRTWWATAALGAVLTLRHQVPRTSANSLEPYFHPRVLAFGLGLLAVAAVLRRRSWPAVALVAAAAIVHVTTGAWFAVLVGVPLIILDARMDRFARAASALAATAAVAALVTGRLSAEFTPMDATWQEALAGKESLLATTWPVWAWMANLGLLALLWWAHQRRRRHDVATPEDGALVLGATALVLFFLLTLPLVASLVTLPVQLQISRVFWLVDTVATIYLVAVAVDRPAAVTGEARAWWRVSPQMIAVLLLAVSVARGAYIMLVERPERSLFAVRVVDSPWEDAMRWIAAQPPDTHVLADPDHALKYGTSVRASGRRDVLLEETKDSAMAIYGRDAAARVVDRRTAIGDFSTMTAGRARELARRYDLDYLITEADLPLPDAYRNAQFRIYRLQ